MRELVLLMAAVLGLGYWSSGGEDAPDHAGPIRGWHEKLRRPRPAAPGPAIVAGVTECRSRACREMRLADPGYRPHVARDDDEATAPR